MNAQTQYRSTSRSCLTALKRLIRIWPKPDGSQPSDFRSQLTTFLAENFKESDLLNAIERVVDVKQIEEQADRVRIEFSDVDGCIQRADFVPGRRRKWLLQSIRFQCPVCFGSGENEGQACTACGGLGWGAS